VSREHPHYMRKRGSGQRIFGV